MTPFFTVIIYRLFFGKTYNRATYVSLVPVVAGVGFATAGDYYFTTMGFCLTLLGAFLAALKTVVTNRIQTGRLKLSPLELLYRMSPLAFVQTMVYAWYTGEMAQARTWAAGTMGRRELLILLTNGAIAFGLNVISFTANKKTGALTMTVAANVKQILTIVLSIFFWGLQITWMNSFGILLTLFGGAWYAYVSGLFVVLVCPTDSLGQKGGVGEQELESSPSGAGGCRPVGCQVRLVWAGSALFDSHSYSLAP